MKRILSVQLIIALIFCLVCIFSSCEDDEHTHSYGAWSIKTEAECDTDGVREKECSCGDIVTEKVPALGHNFVGGICTDCGEAE